MSYRVVTRGAILIPILLLLFRQAASAPAPSPAPAPLFGLLGDALGGGNTTSLIAALALAHIEHTIDKLNALADAAGTLLTAG